MIKIVIGILGGFMASQVLYPITHGAKPKAPETFGLVLGSLIVVGVYGLMGASDEDIQTLMVAFASVGIGVGCSRVVSL